MELRVPLEEFAVLGGCPSRLSGWPEVGGRSADRSSGCSAKASSLGFPLEKALVVFPAHIKLLRMVLFPADNGGFEGSFCVLKVCVTDPDRELGLAAMICSDARIRTTRKSSDSADGGSPMSPEVKSANRVRSWLSLVRWPI